MMKTTSNYKVEKLGNNNINVYDIEVNEFHNFYANGILCHNSLYTTSNIPRLVRARYGDDVDNNTMINHVSAFINQKVIPVIDEGYQKLADYMNSHQKMNMKLEAISDKAIMLAPKMYVIRILNDEGVMLKKPKIKIKGIEIVRSTTPKFVKPKLTEFINLLLGGNGINDVRNLCVNFKKEFDKASVFDIAKPATMNHTLKYASIPSGTPYHIKAGLLFNKWLDDHKISHIPRLEDGVKMKVLSLKTPNIFYNNDYIAFSLDYFPEEIKRFVDYDEQFDKMFFSVVTRIFMVLGVDINIKRRKLPFVK